MGKYYLYYYFYQDFSLNKVAKKGQYVFTNENSFSIISTTFLIFSLNFDLAYVAILIFILFLRLLKF